MLQVKQIFLAIVTQSGNLQMDWPVTQQPSIKASLHQSTADTLLQPCTNAYNEALPQMSGLMSNPRNVTANKGPKLSYKYRSYNAELLAQIKNIFCTLS